ncbi:MAG: ATP-binding protein [Lachnospiraceae bacterium]|nr:ATP-binding protein [Lachnospiraceae bacterium]
MPESKLIRAVFISSMVTMIMSNLATFAGSMVDGVITSRFLGSECMAAFQLSIPLNLCVVMIFQVFSIGVQNTCARFLGEGKPQSSISAYTTSVLILTVIGIIAGAAAAAFHSPISALLGATGSKASLSGDLGQYITGLSFGLPVMFIMPLTIGVMYIEGRGNYVVTAVILQAAVDVAGDLLNIFVFRKGMLGMGIATSVCNYASFLFLIFVRFRFYEPIIRVDRHQFRLSSLKEVFRVGFPAAVDRMYKTIQMYTVNIVLAAIATSAEIAAFGAINTLNYIYNPVTMGIGTAVLTMSAVFFGEKDVKAIQQLMRYAVRTTLLVETCVAAVSFLGAPLLMLLFFDPSNAEGMGVAVRALRIYVLYIPIYGINYIFQKYYNSIGNIKMNYILSAFDNLIYICPLVIVLGNLFGSDGVFISFVLAEILTVISMIIVVALKNRRMPEGLSDMLDLPEEIRISDEDQYQVSAGTASEVIAASEGLRSFCLAKGLPAREANRFSLAVEELGMNIMRWGREKNKNASVDIRLSCLDGWTLRVRDNGGLFDAPKWLEIHDEDDPLRNFGLRLVLKGAREVSYVTALKINNLIIKY